MDTRKITLISGAQEKSVDQTSPVKIFENSGCEGVIKDDEVYFEGIVDGENNCNIGNILA